MPNNKQQRPRGKRRGRRRKVHTAPVGLGRTRVFINDSLTEPGTGTVNTLELKLLISKYPFAANYSQFKVHKVGIQTLPEGYSEFIVRGVANGDINTRAELVKQPDCKKISTIGRGGRTIWYKPNQAPYTQFRDLDSSTTNFTSGLWLQYGGQNNLKADTAGLLLLLIFDITFRGLTTRVD